MANELVKKLLKSYLVCDTSTLSNLENLGKLLSNYLPKSEIKLGITEEIEKEIKLKAIKNLIERGFISILKPKNKAYHIAETRRIQRFLGTRKNLGEITSYIFVKNHKDAILVSDDMLILELQKRFGVVSSFGSFPFLYLFYKSNIFDIKKLKNLYDIFNSKLSSRVLSFNLSSLMELDKEFIQSLLSE